MATILVSTGCYFNYVLPENCSCYASGYTHEKFLQISNTMDTSAVLEILGKPLSIHICKKCTTKKHKEYWYKYAIRCNPKEGSCPEFFAATVIFDSTYHVLRSCEGIND